MKFYFIFKSNSKPPTFKYGVKSLSLPGRWQRVRWTSEVSDAPSLLSFGDESDTCHGVFLFPRWSESSKLSQPSGDTYGLLFLLRGQSTTCILMCSPTYAAGTFLLNHNSTRRHLKINEGICYKPTGACGRWLMTLLGIWFRIISVSLLHEDVLI